MTSQQKLELKDILTNHLPVGIKYLLQRATPEDAQEIINETIEALQKCKPEGETVTEKQLLDAGQAIIGGVVTFIPPGNGKDIAVIAVNYMNELVDHFDGSNQKKIITLAWDGLQTVKAIGKEIKEIKAEKATEKAAEKSE